MRRRILALIPLLAWTLAGAQTPPAGASLYVTVVHDGKLIGGLRAENFRLFLDGRPTPFKLEPAERPLTLALLVEYSRSSAPYFQDVAEALQAFINAAPEGDWYALATFSNRLAVDVDFTKLKGKIPTTFAALGPPQWSEIRTYDAVHQMLAKMSRLPGQRVLVLIGSGLNTFGEQTLNSLRRQVAASNVTIFAVGAGQYLRLRNPGLARAHFLQADNLLRTLAAESGGEAWFPRFETAFPDAAQGLLQVIEHRYRLVVPPQALAGDRPAKVRVEAFHVENGKRTNFETIARAELAGP